MKFRLTLVLLATTGAYLGSVAAVDPGDSWARYFSDERPSDEDGWRALAREFPNRLKRVPPAEDHPHPTPGATRLEIRPGLEYVRVRRLNHDLAVIRGALEAPRLIIDLRFVHGELAESLAFGGLLARTSLFLAPRSLDDSRTDSIDPQGHRGPTQTCLILVNRATSGALEAVLDALQAAGEVLLVGVPTAGDTGSFVDLSEAPGWRVIFSDFRRNDGPSLLDVGVQPALTVEVGREAEEYAYLMLDAGTPVADLLDAPVVKARFDEARLIEQFDEINARRAGRPSSRAATNEPSPSEDEEDTFAPFTDHRDDGPPFDRTLQRAVSTLVAVEALQLSPKPMPGAQQAVSSR